MKKSNAKSEAAKARWKRARELRAAFAREHPLVAAFLELPEHSRKRIAEALLHGLVTTSGNSNISTDLKA